MRRLAVEEVIRLTSQATNISYEDIVGVNRDSAVFEARALAAFLARELCGPISYPRLGRLFGNRDHTSMMNAVKRGQRFAEESASSASVADYVRSHAVVNVHRAGAVLDIDEARRVCERGENGAPLPQLDSTAAAHLGSAVMAEYADERARLRIALTHLAIAVEEIIMLRRMLSSERLDKAASA